MSIEIEVPYYCPYCENETNLLISAESPSDYYIMDECCPECDASITGGNIDEMAANAVIDYYSSVADACYDDMRDKKFDM